MTGERARPWLTVIGTVFSVILALAYLGVDVIFVLQRNGPAFLIAENLFWMLLYLVCAYLMWTASKYGAVAVLVAGANAGRVSRSIVDPYGSVASSMLAVHAALLVVILAFGLISLISVMPTGRPRN